MIELLAWLSIGAVLGITFLICWIIWRLFFKKSAPAPEIEPETEKEKEEKPVAPKRSYATVLFLLLLVLGIVMIVHRIDTSRWGFAKSAGTFEVPAGSGIYHTGVPLNEDEWIWLKSESKRLALAWDDAGKRSIEIPHQGSLHPCLKTGELFFKKQAQPTRVSYRISSR